MDREDIVGLDDQISCACQKGGRCHQGIGLAIEVEDQGLGSRRPRTGNNFFLFECHPSPLDSSRLARRERKAPSLSGVGRLGLGSGVSEVMPDGVFW